METVELEEVENCVVKLRSNPQRHRNKVYVGCGAGFGGDRPMAALKLLERVKELNYIVLECLAERTLADRYQAMVSGGKGYDPRVKEWLSVLLPMALDREVCIITNMGAIDPPGAQKEVLDLASNLGLEITVAVAYESSSSSPGSCVLSDESIGVGQGRSTYLGAASIVHCLENYKPHVVVTSRVADAALFLAPMVYELGWNWNDFEKLAQGTLASHLLECGCQLTGGYFMHPGDAYRDFSFEQLLDLSLPYAEVSCEGEVFVGKANDSGGLLSYSTCAEQLLYEVGDPANYITPDLVVDFSDVQFHQISKDKVHCIGAKPSNPCRPEKLLQLLPTEIGWKGWGEISYGGQECLRRTQAAEYLVRSWMDERYPNIEENIVSYIMGYDSLKAIGGNKGSYCAKEVIDARLRMDGLFEQEEHADGFVEEFTALYTNGPAGGGGISTGRKKEMILQKLLIDRENIFWQANVKNSVIPTSQNQSTDAEKGRVNILHDNRYAGSYTRGIQHFNTNLEEPPSPVSAPSGSEIALYHVAHSRAGDKGNDLNLSIIPHFPRDIVRLRTVITPDWVKNAVLPLLDFSPFPNDRAIMRRDNILEHVVVEIYDVPGISSLNIVVRSILDGGVNCSRRIDRHGKTLSDLILCQKVILPL
ncbi:uncharacterized protein LOC100821455 isoform X1 [Brachypodium distachyon]|uniref:Uncharacterized protein n=2 Tax=Brachypodium distachyon TaxID=15368 RepID=A0A0Q3NG92_BRADI|nr:uncharacterized protein LOC100821455 isoform X1 [Brachypodium distachyon]KQK16406.1 hypothetical protein BRADI_1g28600v3 [Brachypodium distachyon]|eukprot:XP_010238786.1 uncharacterized protein LOC100821455 isoform X1 [Brachypodium distachyon]